MVCFGRSDLLIYIVKIVNVPTVVEFLLKHAFATPTPPILHLSRRSGKSSGVRHPQLYVTNYKICIVSRLITNFCSSLDSITVIH